MKKRILLMVAIMAMLVCVFAISVSAVTPNNDGETYVATDGTKLALYDVDGNPLAWFYTESTGYVALRVDIDFSFNLSAGKELLNGTAINYTEGVDYSFETKNAVLLNLRGSKVTQFSGGWSGTSIQAIYSGNKLAWINKGTFQNTSSLKVFDIPADTDVASTHFGYFSFAKSGIKEIFIPKTATFELSPYGGACTFENSTSLERVVFADDAQVQLKGLTFNGCTGLKAISLPESVTTLEYKRDFYKCTSLTAVYLPSGLTTFSTVNGTDNGTFSGCTNMYLVNEPFTYDNIPEKPDVYYFPAGIVKIDSENFKNCKNLNKTLVFGSNFTTVTNSWALCNAEFGNGDKSGNVIFLGNVENLTIKDWTADIKLYFCNTADKSTSDIPTLTGSHAKVFCNADGNTIHLVDSKKTVVSSEATCTTDKLISTFCFCGKAIDENKAEEGTALGHEFDLEKGATKLAIVYANYLANGELSVQCARCAECAKSETAPIITEFKGFSVSEKGDGITFGYVFNNDAIKEFEEVNNTTLEFGFVVAVKAFLGEKTPLNADGTTASDNVVKATVANNEYTAADFVLRGNWEGNVTINEAEIDIKKVEFYMAGYIIVNGAVSYLNVGASGANAGTVTFEQASTVA